MSKPAGATRVRHPPGVIHVGVLGPVSVHDVDGEHLTPRDRKLLAALALDANTVVGIDRLHDALWGDDPPASATKIVQGCIVRLRRALAPDAIRTEPGGYSLVVHEDGIDTHRFVRLVRRSEELLTLGEPERAAHTAGEALSLWRGPAFGELEDWAPARIERERLAELRRDAEELQLDARLRAGRHREALTDARRLAADAPLRECRWVLLARAQYQAGRQADALETLHRARVTLATELGVDPGPELSALQVRILRQDPGLAAPRPPAETSAVCPYRGLLRYEIEDADEFFGREDDIDVCRGRLDAEGVLAVVGASGTGKSSLVRAGVVARLRRDGRTVVVVTPGAHPMDALTAVPSREPLPVLVVDQLEEAVVLCEDPTERAAFLRALVRHAERAPLILGLRADRLGALSVDPDVARIIERGLHLLGPMRPDELRDAIRQPATRAGLLVEPGLVDLLVREVEDEPGALPLLSHVLRMTWERREGRTLTVAGYTASGGIRGAVAQTAEALYERLSTSQRDLLRELLLRLVVQTTDGALVRARLPRRVIRDDPEYITVVEVLVAARLATSTRDVIELAHEAVARAWPRLQAWLAEEATGQRILGHLSAAAVTWDQMSRPDSEVYRGARLAAAAEWRDRSQPHLTPVEAAFLDAGLALADAQRREAEGRAARQARANRRLRGMLRGLGLLSVIALLSGVLATRQARRADTSAVRAEAQHVSAQALADHDIDRSLLLAVEGVRPDDSPDTRANLLTVLDRSSGLIGVVRGLGKGVFGEVTVSPDGTVFAVYDDGNRVSFFDADTHALQGFFDTADDDGGRVTHVTGQAAFDPSGETIAVSLSTGLEHPVVLLDAVTRHELSEQPGGLPAGDLVPWDIAYSPDGRWLAAAFERADKADSVLGDTFPIVVWDTDAPVAPALVLDGPRFTHALAFSPDGRHLYTGAHEAPPQFGGDAGITVYDLESGTVDRRLPVPSYPFALRHDGAVIAAPVAAPDAAPSARPVDGGDIVLSDTVTGARLRRLRGHRAPVRDVVFSPDGARVAAAAEDGAVMVWDAETGQLLSEFHGHGSAVTSVAFGPDGRTLYSAGRDHTVLVWDLVGTRRFPPSTTVQRRPAGGKIGTVEPYARVAPTCDAIVYVWYVRDERMDTVRGRLQVLDIDRARAGKVLRTPHVRAASVTWHPDGSRFASAGVEGTVRVWDARTGDVVRERDLRSDVVRIRGVSYLGNGDRIVAVGSDGAVARIDAVTLEAAGDAVSFTGNAAAAYASPDGRTVAAVIDAPPFTGSFNLFPRAQDLVLLDTEEGQILGRYRLGFDGEWAAFSSDSTRVAVTGRGGQVALIDVATAEAVTRPVVGHDGNVASVAYSPDGTLVASGGIDGRVALWDGHTGSLLGSVRIDDPGDIGVFVGFGADSNTVIAATWDGQVHRLDTRVARWIDVACRIAGRDLTKVEWQDVFGDLPYRETCPAR